MLQVMPKRNNEDTAEECLQKALKLAPDMRKVLVLYELESKEIAGSLDNGMTLAECLYLVEIFKHWMLRSAIGGN
jgi:hypothetical protein